MNLTDTCPRCKQLYPPQKHPRCKHCRAPRRDWAEGPTPSKAEPAEQARIAICTPFYKRLAVSKVYWAGVERVKALWEAAGHTVAVYAGGDEPDQQELAESYGAIWLELPNDPLGAKWNALTTRAVKDGCTHLMRLGSDNVLDDVAAREYLKAINEGFHFAAMRNLHMVEPSTKQALSVHSPGTTRMIALGPGRMYGPEVLKRTKGELLANHTKKGTENAMAKVLRVKGFGSPDRMIEVGTCLDIKTDTNIWPYKTFARMYTAVGYDQLLDGTFPQEASLIRAIANSVSDASVTLAPASVDGALE